MPKKITMEYFRFRVSSPISSIEPEPLSNSYMVFMLEGEMEYGADRKNIRIRSGDALFLTEGTLRERIPHNASAKYYSMLFKDIPQEYVSKIPTVFRYDSTPDIPIILSMMEKLFFSRFYQSKTDELLEERLSLLMELLLNLAVSASSDGDKNSYIEKITEYIRGNYKSKLTLSNIAAAVHLNPSYCSALFHKETGETIGEFIKNFRLDIAKDELSRGSTVKLTAETVGFTDPYNFSKWFSKNAGISPSEYKRAHTIKSKRKAFSTFE